MSVWRVLAILFIFGVTSVAWAVLGGVTSVRTNGQSGKLRGQVDELWGRAHVQRAPRFVEQRKTVREVRVDDRVRHETVYVPTPHGPHRSAVDVGLALDQRLKGLMWYSLYDVDFTGRWQYTHRAAPADVHLSFHFPSADGIYDRFRFVVDGVDRTGEVEPKNGEVTLPMHFSTGQTVSLEVAYRSRGRDTWRYEPATGVARLESFQLAMQTDFHDIDFPSRTMSPSARTRTDDGWSLTWAFDQVVTGHDIGMALPEKVQPGKLATELSLSAPISLLFFFLVLFVLDRLRNIGMHPVNYALLAGAFFAFHLLFSYSVDHLNVVAAFALASVVSLALVVSYLRLVVSARFAFVEAALAQGVYLVGFSLAHFWSGYTGLTVTVLSVATLFLLMQWTGRIDWNEAWKSTTNSQKTAAPASEAAV
jgi:hypothetical protein